MTRLKTVAWLLAVALVLGAGWLCSRLVTLPGVGHLPHEEAPAASLPAVKAFLAP